MRVLSRLQKIQHSLNTIYKLYTYYICIHRRDENFGHAHSSSARCSCCALYIRPYSGNCLLLVCVQSTLKVLDGEDAAVRTEAKY